MPEAFAVYKNRLTWGSRLCAWLREEKTEKGGCEGEGVDGEKEGKCPFDTRMGEGETCPFA